MSRRKRETFVRRQPLTIPPTRLEREWWRFHEKNPHVYRKICELVDELIRKNPKICYYSMTTIWYLMRHHYYEESLNTGSPFGLDDHHVTYYKRLWQRDNPLWARIFRNRRLRNEDLGFEGYNAQYRYTQGINPQPGDLH